MSTDGRATGLEIAVVGMAGRFPGAETPAQLWQNLRAGRDGLTTFGEAELRAAGVPAALCADPAYVPVRGALADVDRWDAAFFETSAREAALLDPQQRLFLECAWEALEDAGRDPGRFAGRVGVFAGSGTSTYLLRVLADPAASAALGALELRMASDKDFLATRVAYRLGLRGPAVSVQTACSTSLVAVHLACQSLLGDDCDLALAGGVSIQLPQTSGYVWQEGGITSPDGCCRAFDADARGTVTGSGCGVVALRRLEDALADGDTIHAVLLGSAINNDGERKVGFAAPGVEGQAAVIRAAHAAAGVHPSTIGYVEAHGTGTTLGDPVEVAALADAFGPLPPGSCVLGALKTSIGHLDAAAGVAGLIKAALALRHGEIPPTLHFQRPNPRIGWERTPFFVSAQPQGWTRDGVPRRAGVSSFGIGGTNAHVVLEEAPAPAPAGPPKPWQLLQLSARSPGALDAATDRLAAHLAEHPRLPLADVAFTLREGRRAFAHRRAVVVREGEDAAALLAARDPARTVDGAAPGRTGVAFLFPGQGAQHPGMGRGLYETEPVFRAELDRCAEVLRPLLELDLREALFAPGDDAAERLRETWLTQPALFAVEWAAARTWAARGVEPAAMLGHSVGEYVAAALADVFSLDEALALVAARGRLMHAMPPGAMLAVPLPEAEVRAREEGAGLDLAAVNAPGTCVLAGPLEAVERLRARLAAEGVDAKRIATSHAFHSAMMEPVLEPFRARVAQAGPRPPRIPFVSSATGRWITAGEAADPAYWARQLRAPVRFADGVAAVAANAAFLLEVGPGRTLAAQARRHPEVRGVPVASTLDGAAGVPDEARLLRAEGALWAAGVPVRMGDPGERRRRVPLPTYPFERQRYWIEMPAAAAASGGDGVRLVTGEEGEGPARPRTGRAPATETEVRVAAVWERLFATGPAGADDDFYAAGGDSLLAAQLAGRLGDELQLPVSPRVVLEHRTVAGIAAALDRAADALMAQLAEQVQQLSDDEVRALLAAAGPQGAGTHA